ncbi:hypothetical protein [Planomicrobium sp. CPCC 101079]|uniref:hypothetical protein n=1 Tax=Planomicrobium sp. CPCC 101079 TaxID=2599618 RepID=UPI0016462328|nr:hypothetical protein [Planomicrobium sp. CPCC 101079]
MSHLLLRIEWLLIGTGFLMLAQGLFLMRNKVLVEAGKPAIKNTVDPVDELK